MSTLGINLVFGSGGTQFHVRLSDNVLVGCSATNRVNHDN